MRSDNMRMRFKQRSAFALGAFTAGLVLWLPNGAAGLSPEPEPPGMVGIVRGQTARLNVVNIPNSRKPQSCDVKLRFFDAAGTRLAESAETLEPNQAAFLDFNGDTLDIGVGQRAEIRAVVVRVHPPNPIKPCNSLVMPTLEIFDNATG